MIPVSDFCKLYQCGDKLLFEYTPNLKIYTYNGSFYEIDEDLTEITISVQKQRNLITTSLSNIVLNEVALLNCFEMDSKDYRYIFNISVSFVFKSYTGIETEDAIELEEEPTLDEENVITIDFNYNHLINSFNKIKSFFRDKLCSCKKSSCKCGDSYSCKEDFSFLILILLYDILFNENFKNILSLYDEYKYGEDNFSSIEDITKIISIRGSIEEEDFLKSYLYQKYIKYYTIEKILFNSNYEYFIDNCEETIEEDYIENKFDYTVISKCIKKLGITIEDPLTLNYKFNLLEAATFANQYTILFNSLIDRIIEMTVATPSGQSSTPLNAEDLEKLKM